MRTTRTVLALSLGVVATLASATLAPRLASARASVTSSSAGADSAFVCKPAPMISDVVKDIPEAATYRGPRSQARVVTYRDSQGDVTEERIPLAKWLPATATAEERRFFSIPAEPSKTSAAHAAWAHDWVNHFTAIKLAPPCEPVKSNSATAAYSYNWSGMVNTGGSITETYGTTKYTVGTPCAAQPDSFTQWVGIGGWYSGRLLQNGFWADHSNGHYAFWEALNNSISADTHTVPVSLNANIGDTVNLATVWNGSSVHFGFHDVTTGAMQSLDYSTILNRPASDFYDGSTGETIDERGTINNQYTTLRDYGTDYWTNAQVAQNHGALTPIRDGAHSGVVMSDHNITYSSAGLPAPTASSFTDTWDSCGVVG